MPRVTKVKQEPEIEPTKDITPLIELISKILELMPNPIGKRETALKAHLQALLNELKSE